MPVSWTLSRIDTVERMPELEASLLELLGGLSPQQWELPTACPGWRVRDIAAHLLDGSLRRLSLCRDRHVVGGPPDFHRLNADWVEAFHRVSHQVLLDLLVWSGPQVIAYFRSLDPDAESLWPVSWAGESVSRNWFDIAREYTERWHHQQQIRDAVGASPLRDGRTVVSIFVRSLPVAYGGVEAADGVVVRFDFGSRWSLTRRNGSWVLAEGWPDAAPTTTVRVAEDVAWRVFTKGTAEIEVEGDPRWAEPFRRARAVVG